MSGKSDDRLVSLNAVCKAVELAFTDKRSAREQIWEYLSTVTAVRCYTQSQVDELLKAERERIVEFVEKVPLHSNRVQIRNEIIAAIRTGDNK